MTGISVDITMTDKETGEVATERFSLGNATLEGDMRRAGDGQELFRLDSNDKGGLKWLFIPYSEAAPTQEK